MHCRDYLRPASGFESTQFRMLENKLGIKQVSEYIHTHTHTHIYIYIYIYI